MYQTILFDLDGTLTDPKEGITKCVQYALHSFGIEEENLDKLECFIGPPLMEQFMKCYGLNEEKGKMAVEKYRERFSTVGLYENKIHPGIKNLLKELKESKRIIGLASSKPTVYCKKILEHFGIESYFQVIVGSELDGRRTDKAQVVREALRQLEIEEKDKGRVVMIGDRKHDILGGRKNGLSTIGIKLGYATEGELEEAGANKIVEDIFQLQEILLEED